MKRFKILMVLFITIILSCGCGKSVEQQVAEQLELGQKYLSEMDYEQAIVAFNKVIELDAKVESGYLGLANAYKGIGDQKQVADVLERGIHSIGIERVSEDYKALIVETYLSLAQESEESGNYDVAGTYYDLALEINPNQEEILERKTSNAFINSIEMPVWKQEIVDDYDDYLKQLIDGFLKEDNQEIIDLINNEKYDSIKERLSNENLLIPAEDGIVLGIFKRGLYYGEVNNGERNGSGRWICANKATINGMDTHQYVFFEGEWENDKPNGKGKLVEMNDAYSDRMTVSGGYADGLENGEMIRIYDTPEGKRTFSYTSDYGEAVIVDTHIGEFVDGSRKEYYVCSYSQENPESWLELRGTHGVGGVSNYSGGAHISW